ncbi:MAG: hypothetical protein JNL40_05345 [Cyclobacteriaceae bacterium]|nr:hypothetical protein [Cyclobacteriaceae bacterium]
MKRVLVCALDWGLGHATRCIPVVNELQRQGAEVFLASSGEAGKLLQLEFPQLVYHGLPGYRPRYANDGVMVITLAMQLRKFVHAIRLEHEEVEALAKNLRLDAVISDNRYGCFTTTAPSILITHQAQVRMPPGWGFLGTWVNHRLRTYIKRYDKLWVPDQPDSGLTNPFMDRHLPYSYVGWLSRFPSGQPAGEPVDLMIVLSGPEPQRSKLEEVILKQLQTYPGKALLVRGKPMEGQEYREGNIQIVSHLSTDQMEARIKSAGLLISRSGYSTVMDFIALEKRAVFIPTPQQPEQLWLATFLKRNGIAFCMDQQNFVLATALAQSSNYSGLGALKPVKGLLEKEISTLLS